MTLEVTRNADTTLAMMPFNVRFNKPYTRIASTAIADIELLKNDKIGTEELPLEDLPENLTSGIVGYRNLVFTGMITSNNYNRRAAREATSKERS
jgi:hypothetical protein